MQKQAKKHFFRIEVKKILLPFRFISPKSENDGSFHFFFVLFWLHSIFVSIQIYEAEKILLPFPFILLRSKNDGAP